MIVFAIEHYILIGLYAFLFALVNINVFQIIIRQRRYKTWPLLAFYIFAYIAITFRLIVMIWMFEKSTGIYIVSAV